MAIPVTAAEFDVTEVFRDEWPRLVARLVRDLGDVGLAEDTAQDAFVEAARRWSPGHIPDVPAAWLLTTARRKAIDHLRRSKRLNEKLADLAADVARQTHAEHVTSNLAVKDDDLVDEQLALLLGCCHPALPFESQVALTLRIVAGLSSAQIARAFLVTESTMTRRLTRAKSKIRAANIPFGRSNVGTLHERLPAACAIVYSVFAEGHSSATGPTLVRGDLCDEAIWLGSLLHRLVSDDAEVAGLLAMMLLIDARRAARVDRDGRAVVLAEQDQSQWDADQIAQGKALLAAAHAMSDTGPYQLQAAIAALHATAPTFADTDWTAIVNIYDVLMRRQPSAILGLNRAIAIFHRDGVIAGLDALNKIEERMPFSADLVTYPYFHSARAEMLAAAGRTSEAVTAFGRALSSCSNEQGLAGSGQTDQCDALRWR